MTAPPFAKVAVIGLGLIGSSFARAVREKGMAERITGSARSQKTCALAEELGIVDQAFADPAEAVHEATWFFSPCLCRRRRRCFGPSKGR